MKYATTFMFQNSGFPRNTASFLRVLTAGLDEAHAHAHRVEGLNFLAP